MKVDYNIITEDKGSIEIYNEQDCVVLTDTTLNFQRKVDRIPQKPSTPRLD